MSTDHNFLDIKYQASKHYMQNTPNNHMAWFKCINGANLIHNVSTNCAQKVVQTYKE